MIQKSGTPKSSSERIVKDIRRATRKQYSAEEKIRIVANGVMPLKRRSPTGSGLKDRTLLRTKAVGTVRNLVCGAIV